jgi:hypothetical protein
MPNRPSKNVVGKYLEFPPDLADEVDQFAKARGATFKSVVMEALRRHLDNPPPPPAAPPPLPPVTSAAPASPPVAKGKKPKK